MSQQLPENWSTALHFIANAPTNLLIELVYVYHQIRFRSRQQVRERWKKPDLIVECFDLWLNGVMINGILPAPQLPKKPIKKH